MPQSSYDQILASIRSHQTNDARVSFASQNVNPALSAGTVAQANAYPFMSPQTAYGLAQQGAQPGDQLSQAVAAGVINHKGGGFWHSFGHIVDAPLRAASSLAATVIPEVQHGLKTAARIGLTGLETPFQVGMGAVRDVAGLTGDIGAGIASGVGTGAAVGAISGAGAFSWLTAPIGAAIGGAVGGIAGAAAQARGINVESKDIQNPFAQSSGGLALGNLFSGNRVDLGSGFMPGGAIRDQQAKNAAATASINGHALTPGRMLASAVVRPGTTPYNLLSGLTDAVDTWELDPSRYLLEGAAAERAVGKLIPVSEATTKTNVITSLARRAGILDAADPAVHTGIARNFLTSDGAVGRFIDKVVTTDSASVIREASNGKLAPDIVNKLATMTDRQQILDTLVEGAMSGDIKQRAAIQAGRDLTSTITATRPGARLAATMDRLGGVLPQHSVDLMDIDKDGGIKLGRAVDQMSAWLKQARYSAAERQPILDKLLAATNTDEASKVFEDTITSDFKARLAGRGVDNATIDKIVSQAKADKTLLESQNAVELAGDKAVRAINITGEPIPVDPINQVTEYSKYNYQLPDAKDVRRITTPTNTKVGESLSAMYNSDAWKSSIHAGEWAMQQWKKFNLARPALAIRMMAMETAKMAAHGYDTQFSDMGSLFRMVLNPELRPQFWEGLREGIPLSNLEDYSRAMSSVTGHLGESEKAAYQAILTPDHPDFSRSWSAKLAEQHADPIARSIAGQGFEATTQSFWDGPLAGERERLVESGALEDTRAAADAHVNDTVGSHVHALTADNPDLLRAIATGQIAHDDGTVTHLLTLDAHGERIHALATKAADDAAEAAVRSARRGTAAAPAAEAAAPEVDKVESAAQRAARKAARESAQERLGGGPAEAGTMASRSKPVPLKMGEAPRVLSAPERAAVEEARKAAYDAAHQAATSEVLKAAKGRLVNPEVEGHLNGLIGDSNVTVPNEIPAPKDPALTDPDYGHKIGRMTQWFYSTLIGKPMNVLVRSPEFNQAFWREVADMAPRLDAEGAAALRARLATDSPLVKISADTRQTIQAALDHPQAGTGALNYDHMEHLSSARAVDTVQSMTINMANKNGWQDAMRMMMPFSKHWQQELTQWARLMADHPDTFRKAEMVVHGAQGSGFFHKDANGNYVFNYPGSGLVNRMITGVPGGFTGQAGGLAALTTNLLPGFGPLVSIPAAKLLPNKPEYDDIRNFMNPYGDPTQKGVLSSITPPWAKTLQAAFGDPQNDRDTANTTMQVARYLVSTGKYSMDTPESQNELMKEAGSRARKLLILQAVGKFALPSSPSLEAVAKVGPGDGRTVVAKLLSDDLQKMRTTDYEHSTENFLQKYGDHALLFLQGATREITPGAATTKEQENFARANPALVEALPNSYAFFAPQGGQSPDYNAVARLLHTGDKQKLTPKQQVSLANDQVGNMVFYQFKATLGPRISTPQQEILGQIKTALMEKYPGFNTIIPGLAARPIDTPANVQDVLIPELKKSLTIDAAKNSDTGKALAQYLELRSGLDAISQERGNKPGSFAQAQKTSDLRGILRQAALQLAQGNAGFSMLFDRILDRELKTDTSPTPTAAVA